MAVGKPRFVRCCKLAFISPNERCSPQGNGRKSRCRRPPRGAPPTAGRRRRGAGELLEALHEGAVVVEAGVQRDLDDARGAVPERFEGVMDAHLLDEGIRGHPHVPPEQTRELALGVAAPFCQFADGDAPGVVFGDVLEGGQQPVQLGVLAHHVVVKFVDGDEGDHFALPAAAGTCWNTTISWGARRTPWHAPY